MASEHVRRIITGIDDSGKSSVAFDDRVAPQLEPIPGFAFYDIWESRFPFDPQSEVGDTVTRPYRLPDRPGEVIFKRVLWPSSQHLERHPGWQETLYGAIGDEFNTGGDIEAFMHQTPTVDYIYVISGQIDCVLEKETVTLKSGDCFVQRETNHGWVNPYDAPCEMLCVMVHSGNSHP